MYDHITDCAYILKMASLEAILDAILNYQARKFMLFADELQTKPIILIYSNLCYTIVTSPPFLALTVTYGMQQNP